MAPFIAQAFPGENKVAAAPGASDVEVEVGLQRRAFIRFVTVLVPRPLLQAAGCPSLPHPGRKGKVHSLKIVK